MEKANPLLLTALSAGLLLAGAAAAAPSRTTPERPRIARCHMGGCGWFRVYNRKIVRSAGGETLLRLSIAEGASTRRAPRHPERAPVRWDAPTNDYYFLCSATRPTVIVPRDGGGWNGYRLDFVNGPGGAATAVAAQYVEACHPGERMDAPGFAARHDYRATEPAPEIRLARPEDVFAVRSR